MYLERKRTALFTPDAVFGMILPFVRFQDQTPIWDRFHSPRDLLVGTVPLAILKGHFRLATVNKELKSEYA
jgi:hypothetical protein